MDYLLPITKPIRTTAPTLQQEPVTLDEARRQCGIAGDTGFYDPDLMRLIATARANVESDTGVVFYTGSHTWTLTEWPCGDTIELPLRPVTSITSITYVDGDGTTQTWSSSNYVAPDSREVIPAIKLAYTASWPAIRGDDNGIVITFVAGYATVLAVPPNLKTLVLTEIGLQWEARQGNDIKNWATCYDRQHARNLRPSYP